MGGWGEGEGLGSEGWAPSESKGTLPADGGEHGRGTVVCGEGMDGIMAAGTPSGAGRGVELGGDWRHGVQRSRSC